MNDKPDSRDVVARMTSKQRGLLEEWLFEENISYVSAIKRCKARFGITVHPGATRRFYQRTMQRRTLEHIAKSVTHANAVAKTFIKNPSKTFEAIRGIIGQMVFEASVDPKKKPSPRMLKQLIEIYLATRKDDRETARFAFERERWEVDVARLCFEHHAELQKISADSEMDEDARLLAIRHRLFGPDLPK